MCLDKKLSDPTVWKTGPECVVLTAGKGWPSHMKKPLTRSVQKGLPARARGRVLDRPRWSPPVGRADGWRRLLCMSDIRFWLGSTSIRRGAVFDVSFSLRSLEAAPESGDSWDQRTDALIGPYGRRRPEGTGERTVCAPTKRPKALCRGGSQSRPKRLF